jgi:hypothetical protein
MFLAPVVMAEPDLRASASAKAEGDDDYYCDGNKIDIVRVEVLLAEEKPQVQGGKLFRNMRTSGIVGYARDGSVYWLAEGGGWEQLRGPQERAEK